MPNTNNQPLRFNRSGKREEESFSPFQPGQRVPHSGIYRVQHYRHRAAHDLTFVQGAFFPECRHCGDEVIFLPVRLADRIHEDFDFNILSGAIRFTG